MVKKILVTGGAGFIGSNFVHLLLKKEPAAEIIVLDKLTYAGNKENLKDVMPAIRFVQGDICDPGIVAEAMQDIDVVYHFAAESHVDRSIVAPQQFLHTNVLGTHVLLRAAKECGVKLFVHVSTDEVYGSREEGSFKETDRFEPSSPYSSSKAASDLLALSYFTTYKLPVIVTRSSNNYGPYQYPEKVIPLFITNLLEGKKVPLYGDGKNVRDWIYVKDNCAGIYHAAQHGTPGTIYNIGAGNELQNVLLTKTVLKEMGKDDSSIEYVQDRPGHDRRYSIDCRRMHVLGWKPATPFAEGLKRTVQWYTDNQQWWKKLKQEQWFKEKYK